MQSENLAIFVEQIRVFKEFLTKATPDEKQSKNMDYMLQLGELFTLIPYAQLICESSKLQGTDAAIIEEIFNFIVRDFSAFALRLYTGQDNTAAQQELILKMIKRPAMNAENFATVWQNNVATLADQYSMNA